MTARTLPQQHCRNTVDHQGHNWTMNFQSGNSLPWRCPGRYTPSAHRAPDASPAQPMDPFAGIAAAYGDEE